MIDLTALILLPQDQLTLASEHESQEMHRYRRLALSFLPNAPDTSRIMVLLGKECEQRLASLREVAERMELGSCIASTMAAPPLNRVERHFFIVNDTMATQALEQAIDAAEQTQRFFELLLETNSTPELYTPLQSFARQKHAEWLILKECHAQHIMASLPLASYQPLPSYQPLASRQPLAVR